ncbi:MAG: putative aminohydrolase SsnA [Ignavibacteriales bacterium]
MIAIKSANVIHFYPPAVTYDVDIIIDKNKIEDCGHNIAGKYKADRILDLHGRYVSPGLVCSHNHFYSALSRGIIADIKPSGDFVSILKNLWWRLDVAIDEEILYYSGIIGALEAIKAGTTSVIDHNASPSCISHSLSTLRKCFERAGLRGILAYEVTDRNGEQGMLEGIEESLEFIRSVDCEKQQRPSSCLVESAVGAHAPFTLSDRTLQLLSDAVLKSKRGIHIHVAEDTFDVSYSHHFHGKDIIQRLADFNILNNMALLVHGVSLNEHDLDLINNHDAFLVHNPRSNMNNSVGYLNKLHMVRNPALGTDGIGSDMFEEFKIGFFKNSEAHGKLSMMDLLKILQNGNMILERYFSYGFGRIEKGYAADLVIYDYNAPTPLLPENLGGHLAFGMTSRDVDTVIINGNIVYENRKFPFDVEPLYSAAREQAGRLWSKM